eukprot:gene5297-3800_t
MDSVVIGLFDVQLTTYNNFLFIQEKCGCLSGTLTTVLNDFFIFLFCALNAVFPLFVCLPLYFSRHHSTSLYFVLSVRMTTIEERRTESEQVEAPPQLPVDGKGYFACRSCRRVLNEVQWYAEGCLECSTGPVSRGDLMEYATAKFTNFIGLVAPEQSWVGRFIGKSLGAQERERSAYLGGIYAEKLSDEDEWDDEEGDSEDSQVAPENEIAEIQAI